MPMDGPSYVRALVNRGYTPVQAAALVGHILQESGGDPTNVNREEGAHGLLQWRQDRWDNLRKFASERGVAPEDPNLQLDFIAREMAGPEAKAGRGFMGATDLNSASAALKPYIRFGDNSDLTRLNNARGLLGQTPLSDDGTTSAVSRGSPASTAGATAAAGAPSVDDTGSPGLSAIAQIPQKLAALQQQSTPAPMQIAPTQPMITPQMQRAQQLARAMLAQSINPQGTTT